MPRKKAESEVDEPAVAPETGGGVSYNAFRIQT